MSDWRNHRDECKQTLSEYTAVRVSVGDVNLKVRSHFLVKLQPSPSTSGDKGIFKKYRDVEVPS